MSDDATTPSPDRGTVRVMQSFPKPRATTNPYIHMLDAALSATDGVEHLRFDRRRALLGRYDVLHFHWPETLLGADSRVKRLVRRLYATALVVRLRLTGTAVVRTVHNIEPPTGLGRWDRAVLASIDRLTRFRIVLNPDTPVGSGQPSAMIPHGHYVDWFADVPTIEAEPDSLAFVGLVRRYKGVEHLLEVFAATPGALRLRISGNPTSPAMAAEVAQLAARDDRVEVDLRYLDEPDFARAVMRAAGVVLPYRFMHNSGTTLAALSLRRPVLLPRTAVNEALADEVGAGWLHLYDGDLDAADLSRFGDMLSEPPATGPDLSRRDWHRAGDDHLHAYRRALEPRS